MTDGKATPQPRVLDESAIRAQLERILCSEHFDASERNRRFLRYVVEEWLAGRAQQIKAYCVAVSVFNREPSFDPQSDPIVRLEAGRLRRSLEHYYLTAGRDDPIRIVIPKGGYAPRFEVMDRSPAPAPSPAAPRARPRPDWRLLVTGAGVAVLLAVGAAVPLPGVGATDAESEEALALGPANPSASWQGASGAPDAQGPGVLVSPFRSFGSAPDAAALAAVLTDEVVHGLSAQTGLSVRLELPGTEGAAVPGSDVRLRASVLTRDGTVRVVAHLTELPSGTILWAEQFERPLPQSGDTDTPQSLAAGIVAPLADPRGALFQTVAARLHAKPQAGLSPRECALWATLYGRDRRAEEHAAIRDCLERVTAALDGRSGAGGGGQGADARSADIWAALSLIQVDEHRFGLNPAPERGDPLDRALASALRATELSPADPRALTALYTAYCLRRQYEPCLATGERALAAAPGDPRILGDMGLWRVEVGDVKHGLALMERAMERDPAQAARLLPAYGLGWQRLGEAGTEPEKGLTRTGRPDGVAPAQAALAVAYAQLGRMDEARSAASKALAVDPDYARRAARAQRNGPLPPQLDATIRNSFELVGLAAPDAER